MAPSSFVEAPLVVPKPQGWEVPYLHLPHPRPERWAGVFPAHPVEAGFVAWLNAGWAVQDPQPPHPRPERFGAVAPREDGNIAVYVPPFVGPRGFDPVLPVLARPRLLYTAALLPWTDAWAWRTLLPVLTSTSVIVAATGKTKVTPDET